MLQNLILTPDSVYDPKEQKQTKKQKQQKQTKTEATRTHQAQEADIDAVRVDMATNLKLLHALVLQVLLGDRRHKLLRVFRNHHILKQATV
jgi:hypothetical protein